MVDSFNTTEFSSWVIWFHDLNFNTHDTLLEENMSDTNVNEVSNWLTSTDHVTGFEFHGLGSLLS